MADIRINALATTATTPASDDYLALDGTAQGTRKILATNIANNVTDVILGASGPSVKSTLSARAPRQGAQFNGTLGGTVAFPAPGTSDYTYAFWINPTNFSVTRYLLGANTGPTVAIFVNTAGQIGINNLSTGNLTGTASLTAGKWQLVTLRRTGTSLYIGINGIEEAAITDNRNYTVATAVWGASSASGVNDPWLGGLSGPYAYNRALSASEVVALYEAGAPAGADYASGGAANSVYTTDFSSSTGWSLDTGVTISGGKLNLANNAYASAPVATAIVKGTQYRFTITVDSVTSGANVSYYNGSSYVAFATAAGTYTVNFTAAASFFALTFNSFGGSGAVVDNFTFDRVGLLLAPDAAQAGGGLTWYDTSGNAANITLPASGVSWNVPSSSYWGGQLKLQNTTGTNGLRINNISSDTFGFFGGGNDGLPVFSSLNNTSISAATYGWLAYNSSATGDFELYRRNNSTTNTAALIVARSTGNLIVGGAAGSDGGQKLQVSGTAYVSGALTTGGNINLANAFFLNGRNAANTADVPIVRVSASDVLSFGEGGYNATFAGSIAINNTVQTAASVASTHKVTISIGGTTYYLLATNV